MNSAVERSHMFEKLLFWMWHEKKGLDKGIEKYGMHSDTTWKQARLVPKS